MKKFKLETDVLVLGSGPSGFAAAYTAGKAGAKVIIVEQSGEIGGISTSGHDEPLDGSCESPLWYEIINRSAERNEFRKGTTADIDPSS